MQYDLLLRGGRVIDPGQEIDGLFDVAIKDGKIAAVTANIVPSSAKQVVDVCGQARAPRAHRHARPRVPVRHRPVRARCRPRRRALRRHHADRPGRALVHDAARVPRIRRQRQEEPRGRVRVGLSRRRHGRPLLPVPVQARLPRRRRDGGERKGQPRHRQGLQGARRNRRHVALGHRGHAPVGRNRPPRAPARLHPLRPALAGAGRHEGHRSRHDPPGNREAPQAGRHPRAPVLQASGQLRRSQRQGASGREGGDRERHQGRRRPRLAFQLQDGEDRARRRHHARHARRRHARLQHHRAQTQGHARAAFRPGAHVLRLDALLARVGDDRDARLRPQARAGHSRWSPPTARRWPAWKAPSARSGPASRPTSPC